MAADMNPVVFIAWIYAGPFIASSGTEYLIEYLGHTIIKYIAHIVVDLSNPRYRI